MLLPGTEEQLPALGDLPVLDESTFHHEILGVGHGQQVSFSSFQYPAFQMFWPTLEDFVYLRFGFRPVGSNKRDDRVDDRSWDATRYLLSDCASPMADQSNDWAIHQFAESLRGLSERNSQRTPAVPPLWDLALSHNTPLVLNDWDFLIRTIQTNSPTATYYMLSPPAAVTPEPTDSAWNIVV